MNYFKQFEQQIKEEKSHIKELTEKLKTLKALDRALMDKYAKAYVLINELINALENPPPVDGLLARARRQQEGE